MRRVIILSCLLLLTLLSGCFRTPDRNISMPDAPIKEAPASSAAQSSSTQSKGYLKPDVDGKHPPVSDKNPITFHYISDIELDRSSLEQVIKEQMTSNWAGRKEYHYQINWQSNKDFTVSFSDLLPRETIHVSTKHAKTKEPGILNEDTPHLYDIVFQYRDHDLPPAIVLTDFDRQHH